MSVSSVSSRFKLTGLCPPARGAALAELLSAFPSAVWLVVVNELRAAETLGEDVAIFYNAAGGKSPVEVLVFPESVPDSRDMREAFAASSDRLTVLSKLRARRGLQPLRRREATGDRSQVAGHKYQDFSREAAGSPDTSSLPVLDSQRSTPDSPLPVGRSLGEGESPLLVLTTPTALLQPVPALEAFATHELTLARGQRQPFQALLEKLHALDYDSEAVCEAPGQYAVRGGIIDVYPVTAAQPYRLDFFGDELESIKVFDPVTQRSGEPVDSIALAASPRVKLDPAKAGLADYLTPLASLALIEPASLEEEFDRIARDGGTSLAPVLEKCAMTFGLGDLDESSSIFEFAGAEQTWDTESLSHHRTYPQDELVAQERLQDEEDARRKFLWQVAAWQGAGYGAVFVVSKDGEEKRIREILDDRELKRLSPRFLRGTLNEGFRITFRDSYRPVLLNQLVGGCPHPPTPLKRGEPASPLAPLGTSSPPAVTLSNPSQRLKRRSPGGAPPMTRCIGLVVVTETEIFGRKRQRRPSLHRRAIAQRAQVDQLLDFSELAEGDFVVHLQHGIALYRGLKTLETTAGAREVISLEFDDHVTLHVPLQESHLLSRYVGLSKSRPQLGRIGSGRWEKTRAAVERATLDFAAELLRIQAAREAQPGHAFAADNDWQKEFESSFPFVETPDQLRAIVETKADLERARPMDRLICGDVGFGKTEVALRAAFKAVQGGRQVALLVPTTVLAQQHLNTFRERMAGYPIAIEMVSRFRSPREQKKILAATATSQVDILIGTHRLLQRGVKFHNLGLVVIDEEQRFGVKHKEVFKQWRAHVDVLSMSATPIPRTLYLALTGARDMSVIETPPTDRLPIQTIVKTYDEKLVVEAIRHEIRRGGQVFYLHNRVRSIGLVAAQLGQWLPELKIGVGHGRMEEGELERTMTDFVAGKYQVLVCTTIIESGLDIPNCNTLIIEGADRFGLAQLYQLRGRVGRFKHQAYAYLLLHRHTRLLDMARERLNTLRAHNQLGAGFRIAMRDLELRGAGNLLGAEQSGHIVGVGFELYCQLLRQSVARLKGEAQAAAVRANVKLDFVFIGDASGEGAARGRHEDGYTALKEAESAGGKEVAKIAARLPAGYIAETRLRIDFYRRLALAGTPAQVKQIENELRDRFGPFGDEVRALLLVTEIRVRAEQKGLISVTTDGSRLKCLRGSGRHDDLVMVGTRFPRLTAPRPLLRLREIILFLINLA